jgi:hypothetical protein
VSRLPELLDVIAEAPRGQVGRHPAVGQAAAEELMVGLGDLRDERCRFRNEAGTRVASYDWVRASTSAATAAASAAPIR